MITITAKGALVLLAVYGVGVYTITKTATTEFLKVKDKIEEKLKEKKNKDD